MPQALAPGLAFSSSSPCSWVYASVRFTGTRFIWRKMEGGHMAVLLVERVVGMEGGWVVTPTGSREIRRGFEAPTKWSNIKYRCRRMQQSGNISDGTFVYNYPGLGYLFSTKLICCLDTIVYLISHQ